MWSDRIQPHPCDDNLMLRWSRNCILFKNCCRRSRQNQEFLWRLWDNPSRALVRRNLWLHGLPDPQVLCLECRGWVHGFGRSFEPAVKWTRPAWVTGFSSVALPSPLGDGQALLFCHSWYAAEELQSWQTLVDHLVPAPHLAAVHEQGQRESARRRLLVNGHLAVFPSHLHRWL